MFFPVTRSWQRNLTFYEYKWELGALRTLFQFRSIFVKRSFEWLTRTQRQLTTADLHHLCICLMNSWESRKEYLLFKQETVITVKYSRIRPTFPSHCLRWCFLTMKKLSAGRHLSRERESERKAPARVQIAVLKSCQVADCITVEKICR